MKRQIKCISSEDHYFLVVSLNFLDVMGMTSEECLKASIAFELFLFCFKLSLGYLKVVEIQVQVKTGKCYI